jgi:hypothetical protein
MKAEQRLSAFVQLGELLGDVAASTNSDWDDTIRQAGHHNGWFTEENVRLALRGLSRMTEREKLQRWLSAYPGLPDSPGPKSVGIIMAGNIPLVGFHDLMTVLITGHRAIIKTSSQDGLLPRKLVEALTAIEPAFTDQAVFTDGRMTGFTHVIATGNSNSSRYFDYYFSRYPSVIRGNRNSVAVITGNETPDELRALGKDIFRFFGLGCRNVSKVFVHSSVNMPDLLGHFEGWGHIIGHNKYRNNYDYYKAIVLVERIPHLDTGFLLVREDRALACPVSVLHYERFDDLSTVRERLAADAAAIQCVVASEQTGISGSVPFGRSQEPEAWEYADGVDTVAFLLKAEGRGMVS